MIMNPDIYKGIESISNLLKKREISSAELVDDCQQRIDKLDDKYHAVISVNQAARREAEILDSLRSAGRILGPLHGVPIAVKDNIEVKDMTVTGGCAALSNFVSTRDADLIHKLKSAGAIIIAKTNMSELAMTGMGKSSVRGQTVNPYDLTRTPGGSSSGSAVAVVLGFAVAGIGTDSVNSIRSPASACGLVGLRPTVSSVSMKGIIPSKACQDIAGPITHTCKDAMTVFTCMSEAGTISDTANRTRKIGLLINYCGCNENIQKIVLKTVRNFQDAGVEVIPVEMAEADTARLIKKADIDSYDLKESMNAYFCELKENAPYKDFSEFYRSGNFLPEILATLSKANEISENTAAREKAIRRQYSMMIRETLLRKMADMKLDALLYPHQTELVSQIDSPMGQVGRNGVLAAVTGLPALTFPGGMSDVTETAPMGVPIGMELIGPPFEEHMLIELGTLVEKSC